MWVNIRRRRMTAMPLKISSEPFCNNVKCPWHHYNNGDCGRGIPVEWINKSLLEAQEPTVVVIKNFDGTQEGCAEYIPMVVR